VKEYVINGIITDSDKKPIKNLKIQAMDYDQSFFEDRNDDLLGSVWIKHDVTTGDHS